MAYDIGTARGVIELDYNGRGVDQAKDDLKELEEKGYTANSTLQNTGKTLSRAGLVMAAGLGAAVYVAGNFEASISAIGAVSGASADDLDKMREKALQLGADTSFSASEASAAMEELVKAGLSVDEVLNGAADAAVNLAAAGGVDIPTAATIAANAMNQFNLKAEDLTGVVDNIAGAANSSAIDVGQFGESLQQSGAVANLAGVDFDDLATAIALMGNAGIAGSDAGTSLKSMFQRLQPTTKKQMELFKDLGIITKDGSNQFYDAQGNLKDLASVSGVLQRSLKGMTAQQKQATLNTLFGSDAIRAAAILADNGAKGFDKMAKSMGKTSAAEVAAKRLDNFNGKLEAFKGSVETAAIGVGTALLPAATSLVEQLAQMANWFSSLNPAIQGWSVGLTGGVAALLLITGKIISLIAWGQRMQIMLAGTRLAFLGTWAAALGPIALVIIAIAAVVAIIILLWKKSETFRTIVLAVWGAIKAAALAVAHWFAGPFVNFFKSAFDAIVGFFSGAGDFFQDTWNAIKNAFLTGVSAIINFIKSYWPIIITILLGPLGLIIALVVKFWDQIKGFFTDFAAGVLAIWNAFWGMFGPAVKAVFELILAIIELAWVLIKGVVLLQLMAIQAVIMAVFNQVKAFIQTVWAGIKAVISAAIGFIVAVVRNQFNAIRAVVSAVMNAIRAVIAAVWGAIGGTVMAALGRIKSAVSAAWNAVKSVTSSVWGALKGIVSRALNSVLSFVKSIQGKIVDVFSDAGSWLFDAGVKIIQGMLDGIRSMANAAKDAVESVINGAKSLLPGSPVKEGPLRVLNTNGPRNPGHKIIDMVASGMMANRHAMADAMSWATAPLGATAAGPGDWRAGPARGGGGPEGGLRLVSGRLTLDKSGRAFIRGIAEEAVADGNSYGDTLDRMG